MSDAVAFRTLAGIPPSTASTKDSILVVIDVQNEYADGHLAVTNIASSRPAITALVEKYRAGGGHIIHVIHEVPEGTPVFTPGTQLAEEFDEIKPAPGAQNEPMVLKKLPGSFAGTNLDEVITATGLKKLVLVGYMAHVCVSTTARQAAQRGYDVLIASDAIGDRDIPGATGEEVTKIVLAELGDAFGTIINSADVQLVN